MNHNVRLKQLPCSSWSSLSVAIAHSHVCVHEGSISLLGLHAIATLMIYCDDVWDMYIGSDMIITAGSAGHMPG